MKKISIFIDDISCSGGTERVAAFLANELNDSDYDVNIVSLAAKNGKPFYEMPNGVIINILDKSDFRHLFLYLRKHPCDIMISISMGRLSFKLCILHKLLNLKCRLILSEHVAFETSSKIIRALKWLSYQLADDLVLLTQHDYNLLRKSVRANISVIHNASHFKTTPETVLSEKEKIVLAVGRLTHQKAFDRLLHIWSKIPDHKGWKLRIIGDGEMYNELNSLISELGIDNTVTLHPASTSIANEYHKASLLALTSRYEGLPLVLIEAKSFGVPAIAFDCKTGPSELINNFENGILISELDNDEYLKQLQKLMNDADLLKRMQKNALLDSGEYTSKKISKYWKRLIS
ncbi:glycosyltransferase family 4 protein [Pseudocitrobacter faecalis]|uniref:glycosyltransferase family 4 protein n=1 Tax=Pseudocitrobacter faecalis TaxID=1398493 RepID=UPI00389AD84E